MSESPAHPQADANSFNDGATTPETPLGHQNPLGSVTPLGQPFLSPQFLLPLGAQSLLRGDSLDNSPQEFSFLEQFPDWISSRESFAPSQPISSEISPSSLENATTIQSQLASQSPKLDDDPLTEAVPSQIAPESISPSPEFLHPEPEVQQSEMGLASLPPKARLASLPPEGRSQSAQTSPRELIQPSSGEASIVQSQAASDAPERKPPQTDSPSQIQRQTETETISPNPVTSTQVGKQSFAEATPKDIAIVSTSTPENSTSTSLGIQPESEQREGEIVSATPPSTETEEQEELLTLPSDSPALSITQPTPNSLSETPSPSPTIQPNLDTPEAKIAPQVPPLDLPAVTTSRLVPESTPTLEPSSPPPAIIGSKSAASPPIVQLQSDELGGETASEPPPSTETTQQQELSTASTSPISGDPASRVELPSSPEDAILPKADKVPTKSPQEISPASELEIDALASPETEPSQPAYTSTPSDVIAPLNPPIPSADLPVLDENSLAISTSVRDETNKLESATQTVSEPSSAIPLQPEFESELTVSPDSTIGESNAIAPSQTPLPIEAPSEGSEIDETPEPSIPLLTEESDELPQLAAESMAVQPQADSELTVSPHSPEVEESPYLPTANSSDISPLLQAETDSLADTASTASEIPDIAEPSIHSSSTEESGELSLNAEPTPDAEATATSSAEATAAQPNSELPATVETKTSPSALPSEQIAADRSDTNLPVTETPEEFLFAQQSPDTNSSESPSPVSELAETATPTATEANLERDSAQSDSIDIQPSSEQESVTPGELGAAQLSFDREPTTPSDAVTVESSEEAEAIAPPPNPSTVIQPQIVPDIQDASTAPPSETPDTIAATVNSEEDNVPELPIVAERETEDVALPETTPSPKTITAHSSLEPSADIQRESIQSEQSPEPTVSQQAEIFSESEVTEDTALSEVIPAREAIVAHSSLEPSADIQRESIPPEQSPEPTISQQAEIFPESEVTEDTALSEVIPAREAIVAHPLLEPSADIQRESLQSEQSPEPTVSQQAGISPESEVTEDTALSEVIPSPKTITAHPPLEPSADIQRESIPPEQSPEPTVSQQAGISPESEAIAHSAPIPTETPIAHQPQLDIDTESQVSTDASEIAETVRTSAGVEESEGRSAFESINNTESFPPSDATTVQPQATPSSDAIAESPSQNLASPRDSEANPPSLTLDTSTPLQLQLETQPEETAAETQLPTREQPITYQDTPSAHSIPESSAESSLTHPSSEPIDTETNAAPEEVSPSTSEVVQLEPISEEMSSRASDTPIRDRTEAITQSTAQEIIEAQPDVIQPFSEEEVTEFGNEEPSANPVTESVQSAETQLSSGVERSIKSPSPEAPADIQPQPLLGANGHDEPQQISRNNPQSSISTSDEEALAKPRDGEIRDRQSPETDTELTVAQLLADTTALPSLPTVLENLAPSQPLGQSNLLPETPNLSRESEPVSSSHAEEADPIIQRLSDTAPPSRQEMPESWSSIAELLGKPEIIQEHSPAIASPSDSSPELPQSWGSIADLIQTSPVSESKPPAIERRAEPPTAEDEEIVFTPEGFRRANPVTSPTPTANGRDAPVEMASTPPPPATNEVIFPVTDTPETLDAQNFEILAREVYQAIQQRLAIDRERRGGNYSGRLPW